MTVKTALKRNLAPVDWGRGKEGVAGVYVEGGYL